MLDVRPKSTRMNAYRIILKDQASIASSLVPERRLLTISQHTAGLIVSFSLFTVVRLCVGGQYVRDTDKTKASQADRVHGVLNKLAQPARQGCYSSVQLDRRCQSWKPGFGVNHRSAEQVCVEGKATRRNGDTKGLCYVWQRFDHPECSALQPLRQRVFQFYSVLNS